MHNAVMCKLSLYDVIGITRDLHIKLKSFYNIAQSLHEEAVRGCSFLYIIAQKSVIMSEAFLVDVSIYVICSYALDILKVRKKANIRNRYNQVLRLTQITIWKKWQTQKKTPHARQPIDQAFPTR